MIKVLAGILIGVIAGVTLSFSKWQPALADTPAAYNDRALHFVPPADYQALDVPPVDLQEQNHLATVAAYVHNPGREDQLSIQIMLELFDGSLKDFEATVENELRAQVDGIFVARKIETRLSNGMPAWWLKAAFGEGFGSMQQYLYAAVDGRRGVTVSVTGRLGVITEDKARDALKDLALVVYP